MAKPSRTDWARRLTMARDGVMVIMGAGLIIWVLALFIAHILNVVLVICLGLIFQMLLSPLVDRLSRVWPRNWAILVVVAGTVLIVVAGGGTMVEILVHQLAGLVGRIPKDVAIVKTRMPGLLEWVRHVGVKTNLSSIEGRILSSSSFIIGRVVSLLTHFVDSIVETAITLFITVYLLVDAERIHSSIVRLVPPPQREGLLAAEHTLGRVVGGYVRGQLLLSSIVGLAFGLGSWIIGLPYPVVVGIIAAVMELIPLIGPVLGAVLPVLLAALSARPLLTVAEVLMLLGVVHLIESQLLGPRIIRSQVGLHPVLSVVALMIGADLWGIWGALIAVPAAGIVVAAWVAAVRLWREKVVLPAGPDEHSQALPPGHSSSRRAP